MQMNLDWRNYAAGKPSPYWRGARIAARILLKQESGKPLNRRDHRLAGELIAQEGVSDRLIDQALACLKAPIKI